jgi:type IV pilus assembly protein PilF
MMTRARLLVVAAGISILCGCITTTTSSQRFSRSDDAGEQNYTLGAQYFKNGSYDLARDRLERAIAFEPKMVKAHTMLALTYAQVGNVRLARESFNRSVRLAPNGQDVRNAYAVFLCGQEEYDEARKQFDQTIEVRENDNPEIMMSNAGVCMANKPDLELAEQYFRQALARRPAYAEALIQLAALKHRTGDSLTARAFLQRYLATTAESAAVLDLAIQIETDLGDDRAATDYINRLLRVFPESAEARRSLAGTI